MINIDFIKAFATVINALQDDTVCPLFLIDALAAEMRSRGYKKGLLMVAFADDFKAVKFIRDTESDEPHTNIPLPPTIEFNLDFEAAMLDRYMHVQAAAVNGEIQPIIRLDITKLPL